MFIKLNFDMDAIEQNLPKSDSSYIWQLMPDSFNNNFWFNWEDGAKLGAAFPNQSIEEQHQINV